MGARKPIRHQGRIRTWNDDRGFGFIEAARGNEVFVHIKDFVNLAGRPEVDQKVSFELGFDDRKRRRALNVELASPRTAAQREKVAELRQPLWWRWVFVLGIIGGLVFLGTQRGGLAVLCVYYAIASGASFWLYAADKSAAVRGRWRTPENVLHTFDLLGGWPGGLLAQIVFRHKISKPTFQAMFWMSVVVNVVVVAAIAFNPQGTWNLVKSLLK